MLEARGSDRQDTPQLQSLQMLRAVAALLVVLFHTGEIVGRRTGLSVFGGAFTEGRHGVDLFFVLSGFVITYVHRRDWGCPSRLGNYLFNRISRIYPSVWIMSALALALYFATALRGISVGVSDADPSSKLGAWGIVASTLLLPQQGIPLVNVTWTLKCEIFFYLVFALLIVDRRWFVALLLWQATVLGCVLGGVDLDASWTRYYVGPLPLEFGIGMGMGCAWLAMHRHMIPLPAQLAVAITALPLGLALYVGGALVETYRDAGPLLPDLVVYACGSGLIVLSLALIEALERLPSSRLLVYLGDASYSIYLVHFSVITLISGMLPWRRIGVGVGTTAWGTAVCLAITVIGVLVGIAFHRCIDRPLQRALRRLKPRLLKPGLHGSAAAGETALP